ncbi:MAG: hypothetical protein GWP59_06135 [Chlamydiales bacterium]|nr:ester cyclase [Chlamydiales bacterium]NCF71261.1 hypothetical protein [Chlamydiales bacterium]
MTAVMPLEKTEQKELIKNFFNDIWKEGKSESLPNFCNPYLVHHKQSWGGKGFVGDFETLKQSVERFHENFKTPDLHIHDLFSAEDNKVVVRWSLSAESKSEDNKESLVTTGIHIYRFNDERIVEMWVTNLTNFSYDF